MTAKLPHTVGVSLAWALTAIALLHAYWGLGGRWGLAAAVGGPDKPLPPTWAIWMVTVLLVGAVFVVLGRLGLAGTYLPAWVFVVGCWVLAVALAGGALMNLTAKTRLEQFLFAPLAALLALAAVIVALKR